MLLTPRASSRTVTLVCLWIKPTDYLVVILINVVLPREFLSCRNLLSRHFALFLISSRNPDLQSIPSPAILQVCRQCPCIAGLQKPSPPPFLLPFLHKMRVRALTSQGSSQGQMLECTYTWSTKCDSRCCSHPGREEVQGAWRGQDRRAQWIIERAEKGRPGGPHTDRSGHWE